MVTTVLVKPEASFTIHQNFFAKEGEKRSFECLDKAKSYPTPTLVIEKLGLDKFNNFHIRKQQRCSVVFYNAFELFSFCIVATPFQTSCCDFTFERTFFLHNLFAKNLNSTRISILLRTECSDHSYHCKYIELMLA